jgi:hypothetical protein
MKSFMLLEHRQRNRPNREDGVVERISSRWRNGVLQMAGDCGSRTVNVVCPGWLVTLFDPIGIGNNLIRQRVDADRPPTTRRRRNGKNGTRRLRQRDCRGPNRRFSAQFQPVRRHVI